MTVLVSVETVLLVLLVVLVAGLLRSHAEILRRLGPGDGLAAPGASVPGAAFPGASVPEPAIGPAEGGVRAALGSAPAPALAGVGPSGDAVSLSFDGGGASPTLLAFLTSGCSTCAGFWETLGERRLPAGVETVIVTHGGDRERPARLRALAPEGIPVVMSSRAWEQYRIPGAPYFVLVDGEVRGEGVATTWHALSSLVSDAVEDQRTVGSVDETFAASGIAADDPSLYPGGRT